MVTINHEVQTKPRRTGGQKFFAVVSLVLFIVAGWLFLSPTSYSLMEDAGTVTCGPLGFGNSDISPDFTQNESHLVARDSWIETTWPSLDLENNEDPAYTPERIESIQEEANTALQDQCVPTRQSRMATLTVTLSLALGALILARRTR